MMHGHVNVKYIACISNNSAHNWNHWNATNSFEILIQYNIHIFSYYQ